MRTNRGYGYVPDLPDFRDRKFKLLRATDVPLPDSVDLRGQCPPVYDQGDLGSCTANAIVAAFQFTERRQGLQDFQGSRLFLYYNERVIEDTPSEDSGAMIRDGIKSVVSQGLCSEEAWPYDVPRFADRPPGVCYTTALMHEAIEYRRLSNSLSDMMGCLAEGNPFVFGFSVYDSFETDEVANTGIVPMPGNDESLVGGHAVMCVGYDSVKRLFLMRNSWGPDWGIGGYFWMPFDYLTDSNLADDFWTISKVES